MPEVGLRPFFICYLRFYKVTYVVSKIFLEKYSERIWVVSTFFRLIQYRREGMQLHFHISRHIAHLGWETPVFFTLFNENLKKGGIVEKRGEKETKSMPQVPVVA
jgi:hypothetical protein